MKHRTVEVGGQTEGAFLPLSWPEVLRPTIVNPAVENAMNFINETPLTDDEIVIDRHDLEIMRRTHLWPHGSFIPLKHSVAVDLHGVFRKAILYHIKAHREHSQRYVFLPGLQVRSINDDFWTEPNVYQSGGDKLLLELVGNGWIVA
jgi:hypothetical protein